MCGHPLECGQDLVAHFCGLTFGKVIQYQSRDRSQKDPGCVLPTPLCPLWLPPMETSCLVVSWSTQRPAGQVTEGSLREWRTEALGPRVLKELNSTKNHVRELGSGTSPSCAMRRSHSLRLYFDCNLVRNLDGQDPDKVCLVCDSQELWDNKFCCFKPMNCGIAC